MASVTHDGQTFLIDGRRTWILAASIHYARLAPERWADAIAAAQQAGFNAIDTACPWLFHERRRGKFTFDGGADVRGFIELCAKAGMRVILRPGPFIGHGYDGGGLPPWLSEIEGIQLRVANEPFTEVVTQWFRKLWNEVGDLQATSDGPIILVESEHAWLCANEEQAESYLHEITRILRECGVSVPIFNSNDLWQPPMETIDTWRGFDHLLDHMRQLRVVQPDAPRIVSTFDVSTPSTWGQAPGNGEANGHTPQGAMTRLAQALAGGAQVIVDPFHAGTNFGFLGGRFAGAPDRFAATTVASHAPLGEVGARTPLYHALRRIVTFANSFSAVFTELDPNYHPIALHPTTSGDKRGRDVSVVTLAGKAGRVAFVFATSGGSRDGEINLLLHDGTSMAVTLGSQPVGWYLFDADLAGAGKIEFANLCLFAVVDRSIVVMHGPANSPIHLSIGGSVYRGTVPAGPKPLVLDHRGLTLVICNQTNIDTTYVDRTKVYVGTRGLNAAGEPMPAEDSRPVWVISKGAAMRKWTREEHYAPPPAPPPVAEKPTKKRGKSRAKAAAKAGTPVPPAAPPAPPKPVEVVVRNGPATIALKEWSAAPADDFATGASPRFATLEGPRTLTACGAMTGYGWYRIELRSKSARKRLLALPFAGDRVHLYIGGKLQRIVGVGPGASPETFDLKLETGDVVIAALADNMGRSAEGTDIEDPKGIFGHLYEVKPMRAARAKIEDAALIHPFDLRQYIEGRTFGQLSDARQVVWRFSHPRKSPILLDLHGCVTSGTIVLNDQPVAYFAGATGNGAGRVLLDPSTMEAMRRGKNVLRFAPDPRQEKGVEEIAKRAALYECVEAISDGARWSFARWEQPIASQFKPVEADAAREVKGVPCWWRTHVTVTPHELPRWFDTTGLSKGQLFVNGKNVGRYFTATATGKAVGPQTRLHIPDSMLKIDHSNEIAVFDEHGFPPFKTAITASPIGDLD